MRKLICIVCPRGCHLEIDDQNLVTGNSCPRGKTYAINEVTNPQRMITTTVRVVNGVLKRVPVVTNSPIPKQMIFEVMKEINQLSIEAPIAMHQVLIKNILNTNVDIITTRIIKKEE